MVAKTVERVAERSRNAKHFDTDTPGKFIAEVSSNLHFMHRDTGLWTDIDLLLEDDGSGGKVSMAADVQYGLQGSWLRVGRRGEWFNLRPAGLYLIDPSGANRRQLVASANYGNVVWAGNRVTIGDIFPGVDLEVRFAETSLRKLWKVRTQPTLPDPVSLGWDPAQTVLVFGWAYQTALTVQTASTHTPVGFGYFGSEALEVLDSGGEVMVFFQEGTRYRADLDGQEPVGLISYRSGPVTVDIGETVPYQVLELLDWSKGGYVVDPSTDVEVSTGSDDGFILNGVNAWTTEIYGYCGGSYRSYFRFDLSSLSGFTCDSTSLNLYCDWVVSPGEPVTAWFDTGDWGTLTTADWGCGDNSHGTIYPSEGAWNSWTATPSDIEGRFGAYAAYELISTPSGDYGFFAFENGSLVPYLSITYSTGTVTPGVTFDFDAEKITVIGGTPPA